MEIQILSPTYGHLQYSPSSTGGDTSTPLTNVETADTRIKRNKQECGCDEMKATKKHRISYKEGRGLLDCYAVYFPMYTPTFRRNLFRIAGQNSEPSGQWGDSMGTYKISNYTAS